MAPSAAQWSWRRPGGAAAAAAPPADSLAEPLLKADDATGNGHQGGSHMEIQEAAPVEPPEAAGGGGGGGGGDAKWPSSLPRLRVDTGHAEPGGAGAGGFGPTAWPPTPLSARQRRLSLSKAASTSRARKRPPAAAAAAVAAAARGLPAVPSKLAGGLAMLRSQITTNRNLATLSAKQGIAGGLAATLCITTLPHPYDVFSKVGLWMLITIDILYEANIGLSLSKGFNRIVGTFSAGSLALAIDQVGPMLGWYYAPFVVLCVVVGGAGFRFIKGLPGIKEQWGYSLTVATICFHILIVTGYRTSERLVLPLLRFSMIVLGACLAVLINLSIRPTFAGDSLHKLVSKNFETAAVVLQRYTPLSSPCMMINLLCTASVGSGRWSSSYLCPTVTSMAKRRCVDEYVAGHELDHVPDIKSGRSEDDKIHQSYNEVLMSDSEVDKLLAAVRWEPCHGKFFPGYPWHLYDDVHDNLRYVLYDVIALDGCLRAEIQAPKCLRDLFAQDMMTISNECAKVLRILGDSICKMQQFVARDNVQRMEEASLLLQHKVYIHTHRLLGKGAQKSPRYSLYASLSNIPDSQLRQVEDTDCNDSSGAAADGEVAQLSSSVKSEEDVWSVDAEHCMDPRRGELRTAVQVAESTSNVRRSNDARDGECRPDLDGKRVLSEPPRQSMAAVVSPHSLAGGEDEPGVRTDAQSPPSEVPLAEARRKSAPKKPGQLQAGPRKHVTTPTEGPSMADVWDSLAQSTASKSSMSAPPTSASAAGVPKYVGNIMGTLVEGPESPGSLEGPLHCTPGAEDDMARGASNGQLSRLGDVSCSAQPQNELRREASGRASQQEESGRTLLEVAEDVVVDVSSGTKPEAVLEWEAYLAQNPKPYRTMQPTQWQASFLQRRNSLGRNWEGSIERISALSLVKFASLLIELVAKMKFVVACVEDLSWHASFSVKAATTVEV
eukprot:SM000175S03280  [mRNA]  locus=s175:14809:19035:- [translate_table: standard]